MNEYLNNKFLEKIINQFQDSKRQKIKLNLLIDEIKETIIRKRTRKIKSINNKSQLKEKQNLLENVLNEHEDSKQKLAVAFFTLAENIVRYAKFQLIDTDDAVQEGVMICFEKIDRFDSRKGKAFNYMTTCILNHYRQLYRTARNYNELKKRYLSHMQLEDGMYFKNGKMVIDNNQ